MLNLSEFRRLQREDPSELFEWLELDVRLFLFGVLDQTRDWGKVWGGEYKVVINQNILLEFLPHLTEEMHDADRCPQFCVMPNDERAGQDATHDCEGDESSGLSPYQGTFFYVSHADYAALREELREICLRYEDFIGIPDTYFLNTKLVHLLSKRVLEHPEVKRERRFDFTKTSYPLFLPHKGDGALDEEDFIGMDADPGNHTGCPPGRCEPDGCHPLARFWGLQPPGGEE